LSRRYGVSPRIASRKILNVCHPFLKRVRLGDRARARVGLQLDGRRLTCGSDPYGDCYLRVAADGTCLGSVSKAALRVLHRVSQTDEAWHAQPNPVRERFGRPYLHLRDVWDHDQTHDQRREELDRVSWGRASLYYQRQRGPAVGPRSRVNSYSRPKKQDKVTIFGPKDVQNGRGRSTRDLDPENRDRRDRLGGLSPMHPDGPGAAMPTATANRTGLTPRSRACVLDSSFCFSLSPLQLTHKKVISGPATTSGIKASTACYSDPTAKARVATSPTVLQLPAGPSMDIMR
jgi:hypothetical protein